MVELNEKNFSLNDVPAIIEKKSVVSWIKMLKNEGFGFVSGKFHPDWTINGEKIGLSDYDARYPRAKADYDFRAVGIFGVVPAENFHSYVPTNDFLGIISLLPDDRELFQQANYFASGPVPEEYWQKSHFAKAQIGKDWSSASYIMWGDKRFAPSAGRGDTHMRFTMAFFLPTARMIELAASIKEQPDLIEDVFQGIFSGLTGDQGLRRVPTDKLRFIDLTGVSYYTDYNIQRRLIKKPYELHFSHQVGEAT